MEFIILSFLFLAMWFDVKEFKIPNWVSYPLIAGGILQTIFKPEDIWLLLLKIGFTVALMILPIFGGGGDRKIFMGLTMMEGFNIGMFCFIIGAALTGIRVLISNKYYLKSWLPYGLKGEMNTEVNMAPGIFIAYTIVIMWRFTA